MIEKFYNKEEGVLYITSTGDIELNDMFDCLDYLASEDELPVTLKIFEDATNAKLMFNVEDIGLIALYNEKSLGKFTSIRHAVILSSPMNTAFAMKASLMINPNYCLEVFSTEQAAKKWLNL